ncbi:MAG: exosome complex RNA-binding protein Csl4 [Candidatus Diapherotrites archaeon]|nr:exosome complex RNA-binding protein Csl4 [Candidatus Diapherotrites archaeon]
MSDVIFPGKSLCIEEEFLPGKNVFIENGELKSSAVGKEETDSKNRVVSVKAGKAKEMLKEGSIVYGRVASVKDSNALIELFSAENGEVLAPSFATLMVSQVSSAYVDSMKSVVRIADIIKAKVSEINPQGINLSINSPELGVIKAYCINCRYPLRLFDSELKCVKCASVQKRKFSKDYLIK